MKPNTKIPASKIGVFIWMVAMIGLSCIWSPGSLKPAAPTNQAPPGQLQETLVPVDQKPSPQPTSQPTARDGWKSSKDASGTCQVSTPPDWQPGQDFFLESEKPNPGPFANIQGQFPPTGKALWGEAKANLPEGKQFQIRKSLVIGEHVCAVWRIKATTDFSAGEKSEMEQVGKTLQEVH